jgi:hypothetical protein
VTTGGRDRDAGGRARNARPRDALGRPLAKDATGDSLSVSDEALPPVQALMAAQQLLDDGRPFHAHEVLEASWKAAPSGERDLWRGLAQLAVGLTHAQRGNAHGAVSLLRRGADRIGSYPAPGPYGIDLAGLTSSAAALADAIEQTGLARIDQAVLRIGPLRR